MKLRLGVSLIVAMTAIAVPASDASEVLTITRDGVSALAQDEVASLVAVTTTDARYSILQEVAQQRKLRFDPTRARGLASEGREAVFVPVFDLKGADVGFLTHSDDSWTLSLSFRSDDAAIVEGFTARIDSHGKPIVEAHVMPTSAGLGDQGRVTSSASASCQYVSGYGFNFGCWSPSDNPFGYYYTNVYRYGTTPDPSSPSWWACYQGYIHVCPRYESPGSPFIYPVCGFPPRHPEG
jgi:hypothetical protein